MSGLTPASMFSQIRRRSPSSKVARFLCADCADPAVAGCTWVGMVPVSILDSSSCSAKVRWTSSRISFSRLSAALPASSRTFALSLLAICGIHSRLGVLGLSSALRAALVPPSFESSISLVAPLDLPFASGCAFSSLSNNASDAPWAALSFSFPLRSAFSNLSCDNAEGLFINSFAATSASSNAARAARYALATGFSVHCQRIGASRNAPVSASAISAFSQ